MQCFVGGIPEKRLRVVLGDLGDEADRHRDDPGQEAARRALTVNPRTVNLLHAATSAVAERGNALLQTTFTALRRVRSVPGASAPSLPPPSSLLHRARPNDVINQFEPGLPGKAHWGGPTARDPACGVVRQHVTRPGGQPGSTRRIRLDLRSTAPPDTTLAAVPQNRLPGGAASEPVTRLRTVRPLPKVPHLEPSQRVLDRVRARHHGLPRPPQPATRVTGAQGIWQRSGARARPPPAWRARPRYPGISRLTASRRTTWAGSFPRARLAIQVQRRRTGRLHRLEQRDHLCDHEFALAPGPGRPDRRGDPRALAHRGAARDPGRLLRRAWPRSAPAAGPRSWPPCTTSPSAATPSPATHLNGPQLCLGWPGCAASRSRCPWQRRSGRAAPASSAYKRASGRRVRRPHRAIMLAASSAVTLRSAGREGAGQRR